MAAPGFGSGPQLSPFPSPAPVSSSSQTMPPRPPGPSSTPAQSSAHTSPSKDTNLSTLCRMGQDLVQEIVLRTTEMQNQFSRSLQGMSSAEKKAKLEENARRIELQFQKLRQVYDLVTEKSAGLQTRSLEDMLPIVDIGASADTLGPPPPPRQESDEAKELKERLRLRNRQIKQIIDKEREIIMEINTMLSMRATMQ